MNQPQPIKSEDIKAKCSGQWGSLLRALAPGPLAECLQKGSKHQPCPLCGGTDRFNFKADFPETGAAFCNQCDLKAPDGIELLMIWNNWTFPEALSKIDVYFGGGIVEEPVEQTGPLEAEPVEVLAQGKTNYVVKTWSEIANTTVRLKAYLKFRGLSGEFPNSIGQHDSLFHKCDDGYVRYETALVAKITLDDKLVGLQRIYLSDDHMGKSDHKHNKMTLKDGSLIGGSVHLGEPEEVLFITEGIETGLAIYEMCDSDMAVWASVSSSLMKTMKIPERVKQVFIFGDNDKAGIAAAEHLARRLEKNGVGAHIRLPKEGGDWLDQFVADGVAGFEDPGNPDMYTPAPLEEAPLLDSPAQKQEVKEEPEQFNYPYLTFKEFELKEFVQDYLINGIMIQGQPCLLGGPKKTLKTSISIDLAISLASGTKFLNNFKVNGTYRVGIMSAESGGATLQETAKRIAVSKGVHPSDLHVFWCFDVPNLDDEKQVGAMHRFVESCELDVLILDPAYMMMMGIGSAAGNLFEVGKRLKVIGDMCVKFGVTPILSHHTRKNINNPWGAPELEDLSWSGFQEWARQWVLLGRRCAYDVERPGYHELWMVSGGSAGHAGQWGVDVNEGSINDAFGRKWDVEISSNANVHQEAERHAELVIENKKAEKMALRDAADEIKVFDYLIKNKDGDTVKVIRIGSKLNHERVEIALAGLLEKNKVKEIKVVKPKGTYDGYKKNDEL